MINYADLMTKAARLRKKLGEDSNSPIDIFALAQNIEKMTLVHYPLGERLSGMCIKGQSGSCVIAVNSGMSLGRQRFTLAHELYHLYYDNSMVAICAKTIDSGKEIEKEADMFASYFLMPDAELESKAEKLAGNHKNKMLTLSDFIRIEQYFGVSHQAAVFRLKNSKYMDRTKVEEFRQSSVRRLAESMGYRSDLYKQLPEEKQYQTYGYYIDLADQVLKQDLVSNGKYEELLLTAFRSDLVFGDGEEGGDIID